MERRLLFSVSLVASTLLSMVALHAAPNLTPALSEDDEKEGVVLNIGAMAATPQPQEPKTPTRSTPPEPVAEKVAERPEPGPVPKPQPEKPPQPEPEPEPEPEAQEERPPEPPRESKPPATPQVEAAEPEQAVPTPQKPAKQAVREPSELKPGASEQTDRYLARLARQLGQHHRYPIRAQRLEQEGVVVVSVTFGRNGEVLESEVVTSSGFDTLDQAALETVKAASPLPAAPENVEGSRFSLAVPLRYRLD